MIKKEKSFELFNVERSRDRQKPITKEDVLKTIISIKSNCENCKKYRSCYPECTLKKIIDDWEDMYIHEWRIKEMNERLGLREFKKHKI
jgi:hypothetical protein